MVDKNYWFEKEEYDLRLVREQAQLVAQGHDALLAFMPESVTWLTGFFTRAYSSFQFTIIPASGAPTVVCRDMEAYYLDSTCCYPDHVMWRDSDDKDAVAVNAIRTQLGEARAAEAGMQAAIDSAQAGVSEREMAAQICAAMIRAGSDLPGPGVMSSGERAFHLHGGYSDRVLAHGDIVQIETTPNVRHYHARFMRPIRVGEASDDDRRTVERLIAIQDAALATVGPGVPDAIYRDGVLSAGLRESYTNKTFYSVGLLLAPNGGEPLEAAPGCGWSFAPGMTLHTYVLARGFGMSETLLITESGYERLTQFPRQLFVS